MPLHGHFAATHGYEFFTAISFLKLPHLRKVAVMAAIWQPWILSVEVSRYVEFSQTRFK
jgi:hypothetical protein